MTVWMALSLGGRPQAFAKSAVGAVEVVLAPKVEPLLWCQW